MANNPGDGPGDDFLEQILGFPAYAGSEPNLTGNEPAAAGPMMLQLNSGDGSGHLGGDCGVGGGFHFPLGLSLEQGKRGEFLKMDEVASGSGKRFREDVDSRVSSPANMGFHGQPMHNTLPAIPHPPTIRPRVRARRGQATEIHTALLSG